MGHTSIMMLAEIGGMKLEKALHGKIPQELLDKYRYYLSSLLSEEEIRQREYYELVSGQEDDYIKFFIANCESEIALCLVELIMLRLAEPGIGILLDMVSPGNGEGVSIITAAKVAGEFESLEDAILPMSKAKETADFLLEHLGSESKEFYKSVYTADDYLLNFLAGGWPEDFGLKEEVERYNPWEDESEVYGIEDEVKKLADNIEGLLYSEHQELFSILIGGDKESGRYTLARSAAKELNIPLLTVGFENLLVDNTSKNSIRLIVRNCALEARALCIRNITKGKDTEYLIRHINKIYRKHCALPLFLLTQKDVKLAPSLSEAYISVKIPEDERISKALWQGLLPAEYSDMAMSLSSKMKLKAGQIYRVSKECKALTKAGEILDEHRICKLCYEILDDGRYENVKWVSPGFDLSDLKIDAHNMGILQDVINQVEKRGQVYDDWNLRSRYAYGRCVSVILAGPPGTGKTMTVHALASRLGLELYKVDLSQIADKYIGETEKRLEEVFAKAEKSNMILFFDEADAVMGKRGEVKDAHDKYANTQISFILQRIEEYDGIVLLATNNLQNIDTAFMRRIRYVVSFQMPDKDVRKEIWAGAFGGDVPVSEDIDFDYLAETFEFSGGEIKNVVLNAVFYGAGDGGIVEMKHVMKAVYRELTKLRPVTLAGNYGKYSYMLRE
nr:ATP-binding protein [uncultured Butyrivibrio sp.]